MNKYDDLLLNSLLFQMSGLLLQCSITRSPAKWLENEDHVFRDELGRFARQGSGGSTQLALPPARSAPSSQPSPPPVTKPPTQEEFAQLHHILSRTKESPEKAIEALQKMLKQTGVTENFGKIAKALNPKVYYIEKKIAKILYHVGIDIRKSIIKTPVPVPEEKNIGKLIIESGDAFVKKMKVGTDRAAEIGTQLVSGKLSPENAQLLAESATALIPAGIFVAAIAGAWVAVPAVSAAIWGESVVGMLELGVVPGVAPVLTEVTGYVASSEAAFESEMKALDKLKANNIFSQVGVDLLMDWASLSFGVLGLFTFFRFFFYEQPEVAETPEGKKFNESLSRLWEELRKEAMDMIKPLMPK